MPFQLIRPMQENLTNVFPRKGTKSTSNRRQPSDRCNDFTAHPYQSEKEQNMQDHEELHESREPGRNN